MKIDVVIPAYNEEKRIGKCINSLLNQTVIPNNIIIVNDCSTDNTKQMVESYAKKNKIIKLINKKTNQGRGKALKTGIASATGDVLAFTDGDSIATKDWIEGICKEFSKKNVAAVGGAFLPLNNKSLIANTNYLYESVFLDFLKIAPNKLPGANMAIKKNILRELGGLPENTWSEDSYTTLLLTKKNYKIIFNPKIKIKTEYPSNLKNTLKRKCYWGGGLAHMLDKIKYRAGFFIRPAYFTIFICSIIFTIAAVFEGLNYFLFGIIISSTLFLIPGVTITTLVLIQIIKDRKQKYIKSVPLLLFLPFMQEFSYFLGFLYVLMGRKLENAWR